MKTKAALALAVLALLPSCSLLSRAGSAASGYQLIEEQRYVVGDREFIARRYLVSAQHQETFLECTQVGVPPMH